MITVDITSERVNKYSIYKVLIDNEVVACVYGPMAAIATEAIARYLEQPERNQKINVRDVFERYNTQGE